MNEYYEIIDSKLRKQIRFENIEHRFYEVYG